MKRLIRRVFMKRISFTVPDLWIISILMLPLWPLETLATVDHRYCPGTGSISLEAWADCSVDVGDGRGNSTFMCLEVIEDSEGILLNKTWSEALQTCRSMESHLNILNKPKNCPRTIHELESDFGALSTGTFDRLRDSRMMEMWVGGHLDEGRLWWEWDVPQPLQREVLLQSGERKELAYAWDPDYLNSTAGSCVSARYNSSTDQYSLKLVDCSNRLPFICMTKSYHRRVEYIGPPKIIKDPQDMINITRPRDALQESQRGEGESLTTSADEHILTCEAENYHPHFPVVWIKDGVYINNGVREFQFHINASNVQKAGARFLDELQGSYSCEVWGIQPEFRRVRSKPALVTFAGVLTIRSNVTVSTPIANLLRVESISGRNLELDYQYNIKDYGNFSVFANAYRTLLDAAFLHGPPTLYGKYAIDAVKLENTTHLTLQVSAYYYDNDDWILRMDTYYEDLLQHISSPHSCKDCINTTFQIARADACNRKSFNISGEIVKLPTTYLSAGRLAEVSGPTAARSTEMCLFEWKPLVEGYCKGTFLTGGKWETKINNCRRNTDQPSSPVTRDLRNLAENQINADNIQSIAGQLENLTKKFEQLIYVDLFYASKIIDSVAGMSNLTAEVGEPLIAAIDHISSANNSELLKAEKTNYTASRIVSALDKFAGNVKLDSSGQLSLHGRNVDLLVADRTSAKQVYGAGLTNSSSHLLLYDDFEVLNSAETAIILPDGLDQNSTDAPVRIYFTLHRQPGLLQVLERDGLKRDDFVFQSLASFIISATINGTAIRDLESPIIIKFKTQNVTNGYEKKCAYWDYDEGTSTWFWSVKNLTSNSTQEEQDGQIICYSKHLTNFAVIAGYTGTDPGLKIISIIGLVLSIIGLSLTVFSHFAFRLWQDKRRSRTQLVLLNLSMSLLAVDLIVIGGLDRTGSRAGCMVVAALLQYFLLVSFSWMLIEGVLQYLKFVKVFDTYSSHFMYKTTIPAWICPGLIVALIAAIDLDQFKGYENYCWLKTWWAFYFAFLLPLALIMITNLVLFILVIKSVTCDRLEIRSTQKKDELVKFQVLLGVCSFIVMGLAWLSAFLAVIAKVAVMHYLFCILNSIQGFLIFIFLNVREKQVRVGWKNLLSKCCPCIEITTVTPHVDMREIKPRTGKQRGITLNTKRITFNANRNALKTNENSSGKTGESSSTEVTSSNNTTDTSVSVNSGSTYVRKNFGFAQP